MDPLTSPARGDFRQFWENESRIEDDWAAIYDDVYDAWQPCYRAYKERVAEVVYSCWYERRGRVLEVGCGTGAVLQRLAERLPARYLAGVDVSPQMTTRAAGKVPGAEFCATPFEEYVATEPFEVVYFSGVLQHLPDRNLVAERLDRFTIHGSRVVVCEPNPQWLYRDRFRNRLARLTNPWWLWLRFKNSEQIRRVQDAVSRMESSRLFSLQEAGGVEEAFGKYFALRSRRTDFHVTRLFEGVVTGEPGFGHTQPLAIVDTEWAEEIRNLRKADERMARRHPDAGGALELIFEKLPPGWR